MFKIHSGDATHPQLMGKPVDTMGEFPTGVTYSDRLHIGKSLILDHSLSPKN